MSSGCSGSCGGCSSAGSCGSEIKDRRGVKKIIAVGSGKGGVGKSTVSALLAVALQRRGLSVGVLDADITGPSIPRLLGLKERGSVLEDGQIRAPETKTGIRIMSVSLLLEDNSAPVVWRGPMITGVLRQFWNEVHWEGLNCLIVDLPPGTADAPLTVMQMLPVDGLLAVTTPQGLSATIVQKQAHLGEMLNVPLLGLVENMSYAICPHCGEPWDLFGTSHRSDIEDAFGLATVARVPIDRRLAEMGDAGFLEDYDAPELMDSLVSAVGL